MSGAWRDVGGSWSTVHDNPTIDEARKHLEAGGSAWRTDAGVFTSVPMTDLDRAACMIENHCIDDWLVRFLLGPRRRAKPGSATDLEVIRTLYVAGVGLEALEDRFGITTEEVRDLTWDVRELATRLHYAAGRPTREIHELLEVPLNYINRWTTDIARHARKARPEGPLKGLAVPAGVIRDMRRWYVEGQCRRGIGQAIGLSTRAVYRNTCDLPPNNHTPCDLCRPGPRKVRPKIEACSETPVTAP